MKSFLLFFISLFGICFAQFAPRTVLDTSLTAKISQITTADLNNDGLKDLIIAQRKSSAKYIVGFYLNQGNGNFTNLQVVDSNSVSFTFGGVACEDFDGDGLNDITSFGHVNFTSGKLLLYTNTGTGFTKSLIDSVPGTAVRIMSRDLNNDNKKEILLMLDTALLIYSYNNGGFIKTNIPSPSGEFYDMDIADINNDGYPDVIIGGLKISVFKNNNGTLEWDSVRTANIPSDLVLVMSLHLNDFNNDGNPDLIAYTSTRELRIYFNDGTGNFTSYQVFDTNILQLFSMTSADFDADGNNDLLTALPQQRKIVRYPNDGTGNFASPITIYQATHPYMQQVHTDDLNNDNLSDAIWANELSVHLNNSKTVNLKNASQNNSVKIFLAPTTKLLHITTPERVSVSLCNSLGQTMINSQKLPEGKNTLNLSAYKPGIYLLTVTGKSTSEKHKVLITPDE